MENKAREFFINEDKFNDTLGLEYVAKFSETRKFKGIHVIEKSALDSANLKIQEQEKDIQKLTEQISLSARLASKDHRLNDELRGRIAELEAEKEGLVSAFNRTHEDYSIAASKLEAAQSKIAALEAYADGKHKVTQAMQDEIDKRRLENNSLKLELESAQAAELEKLNSIYYDTQKKLADKLESAQLEIDKAAYWQRETYDALRNRDEKIQALEAVIQHQQYCRQQNAKDLMQTQLERDALKSENERLKHEYGTCDAERDTLAEARDRLAKLNDNLASNFDECNQQRLKFEKQNQIYKTALEWIGEGGCTDVECWDKANEALKSGGE